MNNGGMKEVEGATKNYGKFVSFLVEMVEKYGQEVLSENGDALSGEARYSTECGR